MSSQVVSKVTDPYFGRLSENVLSSSSAESNPQEIGGDGLSLEVGWL